MTTRFLFPHRFKNIGWIALVICSILLITASIGLLELPELNLTVPILVDDKALSDTQFLTFQTKNITLTALMALSIIGAILVACSREKHEDEFIAKLRLESLLWATYINYSLLLLAVLFVYGLTFLAVMEWNMFTLLVIFIIRFHFILHSAAKYTSYEK